MNMKKTVFLLPFLFLALMAGAQDFQTDIAQIEVPSFNGKTLANSLTPYMSIFPKNC